jgi:hypothetical protein
MVEADQNAEADQADQNTEADQNNEADQNSSATEDDLFELVYETEPEEKPYEPTWKCTKCGKQMECLEFQLRPSWKFVFQRLNPRADTNTQLPLWSVNELHDLRNPNSNPAILDSS